MSHACSLGLDFGTASVRALIAHTADGRERACAEAPYPGGEGGVLLSSADPNVARQRPADYLTAATKAVRAALDQAARPSVGSADPFHFVGIGVSATGSTPIPVDRDNTPLGLLPDFADDLDAQAWLWKDHTSHAEAAEITQKTAAAGLPYLGRCGGAYSSEWFWSKIVHCHRANPRIAAAAHAWIELSDYIPAWLIGETRPEQVVRNVCAAGHKAMYHTDWQGLPSAEFLERVQPGLSCFRSRYRAPAPAINSVAGRLCPAVAERLGLPAGLPVAVGAIDAHLGALGSGCSPGTLVKIMGTSCCDCAVLPLDGAAQLEIPGVCGVVPGSILPGMLGVEAGQPAVGDLFDWFVRRVLQGGADAHERLSRAAAALRPGQSGLLALDWHNGNRSVLTDPLLTGLVVGETLATTADELYRALIEATAFGARRIIETLQRYGLAIDRVVLCGGVAEKNPLLRQIYADVTHRPMFLSRAAQTCALGAAIAGAVAGGAHPDILAAQRAMTGVRAESCEPVSAHVVVYDRLYDLYGRLHDAFGTHSFSGSLSGLMRELIALRQSVRCTL